MSVDDAEALQLRRMAVIIKEKHQYTTRDFKLSKLHDAAVAAAKGTGKQGGWGRFNTLLEGSQPSNITVTGLQKDRIVTDQVGLGLSQ